MKKILVLTTLATATLLAACSTKNETVQNQTFGANTANTVTIAQAKSLHDDSRVVLQGKIQRQVDGDEYILPIAPAILKSKSTTTYGKVWTSRQTILFVSKVNWIKKLSTRLLMFIA